MQKLVETLMGRGYLMESGLLELLKGTAPEISQRLGEAIIKSSKEQKFISKTFFLENANNILFFLKGMQKEGEEGLFEDTIKHLKNFAAPVTEKSALEPFERKDKSKTGQIQILKYNNPPSKKFEADDFTKHFRGRFTALKSILQVREELVGLTSIGKLPEQKQNNLSIIGMVFNTRITKNKNLFIEMEDLTGKISVVVNHTKEELFKKAGEIVLDDILAVKCSGSREMLFAEDIFFPDVVEKKPKRSQTEEYAAFTSDIHLGSKNFLEDKFKKFIAWINLEEGTEEQKEIAKKLKYLFIVGDNVDGVGIFPGQEELLEITDMKEQYKKLASLLSTIRKDVLVFMAPGQHDAVRVAEPQPPIGEDYAPELNEIENLFLVSNPAVIKIGITKTFEGIDVLMYHGASLHSVISSIEELRIKDGHNFPTRAVKYLLKKRHLSSQHSATVYLPLENDPLVISEVPDIIATGEIHKPEVGNYHGVTMIASSCWQSITAFEEKIGNHPEPCKVPIFNLKTGEAKILDFN